MKGKKAVNNQVNKTMNKTNIRRDYGHSYFLKQEKFTEYNY